jgi:hypothetical protein
MPPSLEWVTRNDGERLVFATQEEAQDEARRRTLAMPQWGCGRYKFQARPLLEEERGE